MKILLAADIFPPQSGGPATYVAGLANVLKESGDIVAAVSLNPRGDSNVFANAYHARGKVKILRYLRYFFLLYKYAKDADVIYAMGPVNSGLPALIAARVRNKKFAVKVVGDYAWEKYRNSEQTHENLSAMMDIDEFQNRKLRGNINILSKIQKSVVKRASKVIVPSNYLKRIVEGWGVESEDIEVIYNAVEFSGVKPIKKPEGEKWIVSAARLVPWKGMETLISVMSDILEEFPNAKLKIIGDGPEFENLKTKVKHNKLESAVRLFGGLPREEVLSHIKTADVFILNSAYEGLPHVLIEALKLRRIICASNKGGNSEVIIHGKTGFIFEYDNREQIKRALSASLRMDETPDFMICNMEKMEEKFSFDCMVSRTREVLKRI